MNNLSLKRLNGDQSQKQMSAKVLDRNFRLNQASSTNLLVVQTEAPPKNQAKPSKFAANEELVKPKINSKIRNYDFMHQFEKAS